jgi:hypothetical protein
MPTIDSIGAAPRPTLRELGWFGTREINGLNGGGVFTLGELARRTERQLLGFERLGVLSVVRIRRALHAHGIALDGEPVCAQQAAEPKAKTKAKAKPKRKARPKARPRRRAPRQDETVPERCPRTLDFFEQSA